MPGRARVTSLEGNTIHSISFNLYYSYGLLGAFDHIYMLICALEILNIIIKNPKAKDSRG